MTLRRRQFIAGLGSAAPWPLAARAQQGDRVRRIGVLMPFDENDPEGKRRYSAFTQALADLGAPMAATCKMNLRWGGGDINRVRALAQELVRLQPDIILTATTAATAAVQQETQTIPIVYESAGDPVASGIVERLDLQPLNGASAQCFGGSLATNSGHRLSTNSRISSLIDSIRAQRSMKA